MLNVGIAGFGFMGRTHYRCWKMLKDIEVVAVCDADPNAMKAEKETGGNIDQSSDVVDLKSTKMYTDFEKMLAHPSVDAVSITLPTYLHADYSIKALSAGVHVLCEKPMALNIKDCRRMIEQAERSGKILQIGQCVRFWPEYAKVKEIIDSRQYGEVAAATFRRLGAVPAWCRDNWFADEKRSGGMALDLHIHDTDFIQYLFGMPKAVCSFGTKGHGGGLIHIVTQYLYDDSKVVTAEGSWAMSPSFGFEMSFNIVLEGATIVYDLTRRPAFRVCPAAGQAFTPEVRAGDGWSLEIAHFAKAVKKEEVKQVTTPVQSMNSVKIVEAEKKSAETKRKIVIE